MTTYVPKEVQAGLDAARKKDQKRKSKMLVEADGRTYRVLRFWDTGFALDAETAPHLRGYVDLYDRGEHLYQCLILACAEEAGQMCYEFKRLTAISGKQPSDFVEEEIEVSGLIEAPRL
jgi:hypothetical protein